METRTKPKNLKRERAKLFFLSLGGFLASVLPLCVLFVMRWELYVTAVPGGAIRLSLGGGMIAAPGQDRLNPERTVTVMVMHGRGKLGTLAAFPTIFKGEHVKKTAIVSTIVGKHVKVAFDRPTALQIDGETVLNVREYEVETAQP